MREKFNKVSLPVCILATPSTIKNNLYHYDEFNYINLDTEDLEEITKIIVDFNAMGEKDKNKAKLMKIIQKQMKLGAKSFLIACTEISELLTDEISFKKIDSLEILLNYVFEKTVDKLSISKSGIVKIDEEKVEKREE